MKPKSTFNLYKLCLVTILVFTMLGASYTSYIIGYSNALGSSLQTTIEPGSMASGYSYIIFVQDGVYYAKNGLTGSLSDITPSTNATAILYAACANGGSVFVKAGTYDLKTSPLKIILQESSNHPKPFSFKGEGANTIFTYTGAGYAITVDTIYTTYEWVRLEDFSINCMTLTVGRNGLCINNVGRTVVLDDIKVNNANIAFGYGPGDGGNVINTYNCRAVSCNYGYYVYRVEINELAWYGCSSVDSAIGGWYSLGGSNQRLYSCSSACSSGYDYYFENAWGLVLDGIRGEGWGTSNVFLNKCEGVSIISPYFNGGYNMSYAIEDVGGCKGITVISPKSRFHTIAFWGISNEYHDINLEQPVITDPILFSNTTTLTFQDARVPGVFNSNKTSGIIIVCQDIVSPEQVVGIAGGIGLSYKGSSYNLLNPGVVMYGNNHIGQPVCVALSGYTQVYCDSNVTKGDILVVSSSIDGYAHVDNSETDFRYILGVAPNNFGSGGDPILVSVLLDK